MEVELINVSKFYDFIKANVKHLKKLNSYVNDLILQAYHQGNHFYTLDHDETKNSKTATIYFNYERKYNEDSDENILIIKF